MRRYKTIVLLGRKDHTEAMRVAAGLTICGHKVRLVFMNEPVADTPENTQQAELLELSDITPETTVAGQDLRYLDAAALSLAMVEADAVINM